jgi:hypothetical protein
MTNGGQFISSEAKNPERQAQADNLMVSSLRAGTQRPIFAIWVFRRNGIL